MIVALLSGILFMLVAIFYILALQHSEDRGIVTLVVTVVIVLAVAASVVFAVSVNLPSIRALAQ